jgi:hypothetical protein
MLLELTRRALLAAAIVSPAYRSAVAEDALVDGLPRSPPPPPPPPPTVAIGTVTLQNGASTAVGSDAAGAALYVTAKPADTGTGIYAQAGKVPPLAAARFATPLDFPFSFQLTSADLTPEFAGVEQKVWEATDLVVTARFDTDGVAATRGPDDLVGRGTLSKAGTVDQSRWSSCRVELQGRGLAGKLLTGGK